MTPAELLRHLLTKFPLIESVSSQENTFLFFGSERNFPIATLVTNDEYDRHSNLGRPDIYRLNIGASRETFQELFPNFADDDFLDYTEIDVVLPHPVYGKMNWICVLNPGPESLAVTERVLSEAYLKNLARKAGEA